MAQDQDWEYEEDDTAQLIEEPEEEGRWPTVVSHAMRHPRITLGGGSLLLSFAVDVAIRFDPFVVVIGLATAVALGWNGDALARGMPFLIPGLDQEQVREGADRFADQLLLNSPIHPDQRPIAKLKRLFGCESHEVEDVVPPPKRARAKNHQTKDGGEGLTFDRIATWLEDGLINDKQFLVLLQHIDDEAGRTQKGRGENGESVKRLLKGCEDGESQVKVHMEGESVSPDDEQAVIRTAFVLIQATGRVTREDIKAALQWNNKKHWIVKAVCDKYGIALPQGAKGQ